MLLSDGGCCRYQPEWKCSFREMAAKVSQIQEHSIQKEWPVAARWVWWESRVGLVCLLRLLAFSYRPLGLGFKDLTEPEDWGHKEYHYSQQAIVCVHVYVCVFQVTSKWSPMTPMRPIWHDGLRWSLLKWKLNLCLHRSATGPAAHSWYSLSSLPCFFMSYCFKTMWCFWGRHFCWYSDKSFRWTRLEEHGGTVVHISVASTWRCMLLPVPGWLEKSQNAANQNTENGNTWSC